MKLSPKTPPITPPPVAQSPVAQSPVAPSPVTSGDMIRSAPASQPQTQGLHSDQGTGPEGQSEAISEPPDQLLDALCDGDLLDAWRRDKHRQSLDVLIRRYAGMVLSVCHRNCRHQQDADDAFQSTFVCLAQKASQIRQPECLPGWLHRVATRASIMTTKRPPIESLTDIDVPDTTASDDSHEALERLTRRHEAITLDEELAELPDRYRSALVLHVMEGHSYAVIAERLESTVGAVRGHVQRGKRLLASRLRRRGIVPVMAFAAVSQAMVSQASAASVIERTLTPISDLSTACSAVGDIPYVNAGPITSLLSSGTSVMRLTSLGVALAGATVLLAGLWITDLPADQEHGTSSVVIQGVGPERIGGSPETVRLGQFNPASQTGGAQRGNQGQANKKTQANQKTQAKGKQQAGNRNANNQPKANNGQAVATGNNARPTNSLTGVALEVSQTLDERMDLSIDTSLSDLPASLTEQLGVPVLMDSRALELASVNPESTKVQLHATEQPVRTSLRKLLSPVKLRAQIQDEGLVITADFTELTRDGVATDRWISIPQELAEQVATILAKKVKLQLIEMPLIEAVREIADQVEFAFRIDRRALEEIGITEEATVTIVENETLLSSGLSEMLHELDLTYMVRNEAIVITTQEAAEARLLSRIYYLEGTGLPRGDFDSAMMLIQSSIDPDTWEGLGGPSTMSPLGYGDQARPALVVSATMTTHGQIESLMKALRETHVGPDPIASESAIRRGGGGGMGGGGMGGGGGGGGGAGFF